MLDSSQGKDGTKEALLLAAIKVFATKGYSGATIREICQKARANVAAINYHYGDKQSLYAAVLEYMFIHSKEHGKEIPSPMATDPVADRMFHFIKRSLHEIYGYCEGEENSSADLASIFLLEMAQPSKTLDQMVARHIQPDVTELYGLVAEIMGSSPETQSVKDAASCIMGQILFYTVAWPIITRLDPAAPPLFQDIDRWTESIFQFSMAGLEALSSRLHRQQEQS